jgi:diguanylate cyclase (GGDEF)-like protein/PAS domain S-box-containing protein
MTNIYKKLKSIFYPITEFQYLLDPCYRIHPHYEALKISLVYGVIGALWILFSDKLTSRLYTSQAELSTIQTYKGWFYVFATMIMVYILIRNRLVLFHGATEKIYENYEELKVLQENLRQEKELSESIFNSAPIISIIMDKNFLITSFSPFAEKTTGYTKEEVLGKNSIEALVPLEHRDNIRTMFENLSNNKGANIFENEIVCKDGSYLHVLWHNTFLYDENSKVVGAVSLGTNITERKTIEKKLHSLAYFDQLTELPNRSMFELKINAMLDKKSTSPFALICMDVDNFKHINDTLGQFSGDFLLRYISNILKHQIKSPDFTARLNGDEFIIVIHNTSTKDDIIEKIDLLLKHLRRPWIIEKQEFFVTYSLGISMYPEQGKDLETLLKKAGTAMSSVKKTSKDNYCFYSDEMHEETLKYINMVNQLRHAIENEEFTLYYQPLVDLHSGKFYGVEVLIRWIHPEKGFISPIDFIPIAEEIGFIHQIDAWVFKTALKQKKQWELQGYEDILMSINISGKGLSEFKLVEDVKSLIESLDISPNNIQIEITETAIMDDLKTSTEILKQLRNLGFKIALDDFGSGYSSLTYLKSLPIDTVKIDRHFIKNIVKEDEDDIIAKSIIQLSHGLNLKVVAEGIELQEQLAFLKNNGCDIGQGYFFSKPIPLEDTEKLLKGKQY